MRDTDKSRTSEEESPRPWNIAHLRPYYTYGHCNHNVLIMINGIKLAVFEKSTLLSFHQAYHSMEESLFLSLIMGLLGG